MNARRNKLLLAVAAIGLIASVGTDCGTVDPGLLVGSGKVYSGNALVVELVEQSTKTKGATTITWDSSFQDLDYNLGDTLSFTVHWQVDAGAAEYAADGFGFRRVTPSSKKDPAVGTLDSATQAGNSVDVQFTFTELHLDRERNVEIGNAHLKLYLMIDEDGDGSVDTRVGYGVNVHVEDPQ